MPSWIGLKAFVTTGEVIRLHTTKHKRAPCTHSYGFDIATFIHVMSINRLGYIIIMFKMYKYNTSRARQKK